MPELHETMMGRKLIEHTLPDIGDQLKRIANLLEKNDFIEKPKTSAIEISLHYYVDGTGKKVYDLGEMYKEFETKISKLKNS